MFSEMICAIGHATVSCAKLSQNSGLAAKSGAFILYTFEELKVIKVFMGSAANGHGAYLIEVINEELLSKLWETIEIDKTEKLPSTTPYADWLSGKHETGKSLIKTYNLPVLNEVSIETHPIVFNTVNASQRIGWQINNDILPIVNWALRNKTDAFADIWELQNPEAKRSKVREAATIASMAGRFVGKTFYHLYYFDFRGRKYPTTAYLHEQGSDLAKGLLLREDKKAIGREGFEWLLISIASNWAGSSGREDGAKTDKIPLKSRIAWTLDNEEIILDYAENPKVNQGWMKADKPWQFLAACNELMRLRIWQMQNEQEIVCGLYNEFDYESHLECFIDGSNNGSQHLSALTRDEITAPHVNLVPLDLPGDLYKYVADHVWLKIEEEVANMPLAAYQECEEVIEELSGMKTQIAGTPLKSELRKELIERLQKYKADNEELVKRAAVVFWHKIKDQKHRRKICKR